MSRRLGIDSVVVASDQQVHRRLGEEAVILSLEKGMYYGVEEVGARVWALVQQPVPVATIRDQIVAEYEVEPARCEKDLLAFLQQLLDQSLVEVVDTAAARGRAGAGGSAGGSGSDSDRDTDTGTDTDTDADPDTDTDTDTSG